MCYVNYVIVLKLNYHNIVAMIKNTLKKILDIQQLSTHFFHPARVKAQLSKLGTRLGGFPIVVSADDNQKRPTCPAVLKVEKRLSLSLSISVEKEIIDRAGGESQETRK